MYYRLFFFLIFLTKQFSDADYSDKKNGCHISEAVPLAALSPGTLSWHFYSTPYIAISRSPSKNDLQSKTDVQTNSQTPLLAHNIHNGPKADRDYFTCNTSSAYSSYPSHKKIIKWPVKNNRRQNEQSTSNARHV